MNPEALKKVATSREVDGDALWRAAEEASGGASETTTETTPETTSGAGTEPAGDDTDAGGEDPPPRRVADIREERAAIKNARRASLEKVRQREERERARLAAKEAELAERERRAAEREKALSEFERARKAGDFDALAKAAGFSSYAEMAQAQVRTMADPTLAPIGRVEARLEGLEERLSARDRELREREEEREARRARLEYEETAARRLRQLQSIPVGFRNDPRFLAEVLKIQDQEYDDDLKETVSLEDAAQMVLDSLAETHAILTRRLNGDPADGDDAVETTPPSRASAERTPGKPGKPAKKPGTVVSQEDLTDASVTASSIDKLGQKGWLELHTRRMEAAAEADRRRSG